MEGSIRFMRSQKGYQSRPRVVLLRHQDPPLSTLFANQVSIVMTVTNTDRVEEVSFGGVVSFGPVLGASWWLEHSVCKPSRRAENPCRSAPIRGSVRVKFFAGGVGPHNTSDTCFTIHTVPYTEYAFLSHPLCFRCRCRCRIRESCCSPAWG